MFTEIGRVFGIDGLHIFQLQNQHMADTIYNEQAERDEYFNRYRDAGPSDNNNNMGYAADFEEECYGDEADFNIESNVD